MRAIEVAMVHISLAIMILDLPLIIEISIKILSWNTIKPLITVSSSEIPLTIEFLISIIKDQNISRYIAYRPLLLRNSVCCGDTHAYWPIWLHISPFHFFLIFIFFQNG